MSGGQGEATLLTTVVSVDPIYASFDADEQTFLRYGDRVRKQGAKGAEAAADPDGARRRRDVPAPGTLQFLDNQLDPSTGTINGRAVFRNADRRLTPGLFVRLRLPGTASYAGVLVEDRAVGTDLDRRFVLRRRRATRRSQSRPVDARADGRRAARRAQRPHRRRAGRGQRAAARAARRRRSTRRSWRWVVRSEVLVVLHHPADLRGRPLAADRRRRRAGAAEAADQRVSRRRAADRRRARGLSRRQSEGDRRNGGRRRSSSR